MWTEREIRSLAVNSVEKKEDLEIFENIVDKDGHKRFIEGDGTPLSKEGVTTSYCKWSLSGSHLMMVVAVTIENGTIIAASDNLGNFALPSWILEKITPTFATNYVEVRSVTLRDNSWAQQSLTIGLFKDTSAVKIIATGTGLTLSSTKSVRIQFDLLIDDE